MGVVVRSARWALAAVAALLVGCQFCDRHLIRGESQVIRVESGHRYYFDLEENATAGFRWEYVCDDDDVEVLLDHRGPPAPKAGEAAACGAPGKASVRIRVHRGFDGPATVKFHYRRPWEQQAAEQFTISLYRRTGDVAFWE